MLLEDFCSWMSTNLQRHWATLHVHTPTHTQGEIPQQQNVRHCYTHPRTVMKWRRLRKREREGREVEAHVHHESMLLPLQQPISFYTLSQRKSICVCLLPFHLQIHLNKKVLTCRICMVNLPICGLSSLKMQSHNFKNISVVFICILLIITIHL